MILTEPAVAPGGNAVEGAVEGGFGGRAGEEDEVVGDTGGRGEGSVGDRGKEADDSDFVIVVAEEDGLFGVVISGIELGAGGGRRLQLGLSETGFSQRG